MHRFLLIVVIASLSACAKPVAYKPQVSEEEMKREQAAQSAAAKEAPIRFDSARDYSAQELAAINQRVEAIAARTTAAAVAMCADLGLSGCDYPVMVDAKEKGLNAYADGKRIVMNPAMVEFAGNDTHLAFVLAHESAHNIMQHVRATQKNVMIGGLLGTVADIAAATQGIDTGGIGGKFGAQQGLLRYSPAFEAEADYVGLYILARTSYPIEQAPNFWRQMSQAQPNSVYVRETHPNNPERTIAMEKTIREIREKQAAGLPLVPNLKKKK